MESQSLETQRKKTWVATLSVASNATLVLGKVIVGMLIGSVSVISEAVHSAVDLLAAVVALVAVRTSGKPADDTHHFGHGKIENVSGAIEAVLIFVAAVWIIYEAVHKLLKPEPLDALGWGVAVMLFSSVLNWIVSTMLFKIGKETDSMALQADAWHLRTDVYTSAGVMLGLLAITVGGKLFPGTNLDWLDPAAAIMVAILIMKAAWNLTLESAGPLLDAALPAEELKWVREHLDSYTGRVKSHHKLRARKAGPDRFIQVHVQVPGEMSVRDSHHLAHEIADGIKAHLANSDVIIHIEPD